MSRRQLPHLFCYVLRLLLALPGLRVSPAGVAISVSVASMTWQMRIGRIYTSSIPC